jgi:hypothetical protein
MTTPYSHSRVLLACAAVLVGCGSGAAHLSDGGAAETMATITAEAGPGDHPAAAACVEQTGPIDPTALIDDMEDADFNVPHRAGRTGSWWAGGDMTPGGSVTPSGNADPEAIPGGRCGSQYAMHVTGQGFTDWGALLSLSLRYGAGDGGVAQLLPYDARAYQGLTFWARIGDTSTDQVRLAVSDQHARPEAGLCEDNGPPGKACYDTFGIDLPQLATTWKQYRIPFSGLAQRDFGIKADALDTQNLYTIELAFAAGTVFDLWVDDISFF